MAFTLFVCPKLKNLKVLIEVQYCQAIVHA